MIRYIELKTGYEDDGPAWIANVTLSKSGRTVYFDGKALKRLSGTGIAGNYYDLETREEYWVSGVKKTGTNRHRFGSGIILIEESAITEFMCELAIGELDSSKFKVIEDLEQTDPTKFHLLENEKLKR